MITQERLKELLHYDAASGAFTWLIRTSNRIKIGDMAGTIHPRGYRHIRLDGKDYQAHRLAWLYVHGCFPAAGTDHINGVRDDNRIVNLREATHAENGQNRAMRSNNCSGFLGVFWHRKACKWMAQIRFEGKQKYLGLFESPESAHATYLAAKAELHTFNPSVRECNICPL